MTRRYPNPNLSSKSTRISRFWLSPIGSLRSIVFRAFTRGYEVDRLFPEILPCQSQEP
jgi:hypothetical protein